MQERQEVIRDSVLEAIAIYTSARAACITESVYMYIVHVYAARAHATYWRFEEPDPARRRRDTYTQLSQHVRI